MRTTFSQFVSFSALCVGILLDLVALVIWTTPNRLYAAISFGVGFMLLVYGTATFKRRLQQINTLKSHGVRITAQIQTITLDVTAVPGRRYSWYKSLVDTNYYQYRIHCTGDNPITRTSQTFVSDILYGTPNLDLRHSRSVDVYVDHQGAYYVDISGIQLSTPHPVPEGHYESSDGTTYTLPEEPESPL